MNKDIAAVTPEEEIFRIRHEIIRDLQHSRVISPQDVISTPRNYLSGSKLFSLFTADIIKKRTTFTR